MTAKILYVDIETAPNLGYTWGKWDQNVISFEHQWYILSYAFKWSGEDDVYVRALPDYPGYNISLDDDGALVADLWRLFDEADIIIGHNGDAFDIKRSNARFIAHSLNPPSSYKSVDTLKLAKKCFAFTSNSLSDLGEYLGLGKKKESGGFKTWKGCMVGDPAAWELMKEYNKQDVVLLEQVYLKLRPWASGHVNLNLYARDAGCPTCQSPRVQRRGFAYAKTQVRQRFHCTGCGTWYSGPVIKKSDLEEIHD